MKEYRVYVHEVWVQPKIVFADNPEDAIIKAENGGEFVENALEYSHSLPTDTWTVEEV